MIYQCYNIKALHQTTKQELIGL